mmetsp:Transcript_242/g.546  ORF Transcript_242/g.546 Transcript_242/m.546 type:complete len:404 (+) Transcript_242:84-1295(+)
MPQAWLPGNAPERRTSRQGLTWPPWASVAFVAAVAGVAAANEDALCTEAPLSAGWSGSCQLGSAAGVGCMSLVQASSRRSRTIVADLEEQETNSSSTEPWWPGGGNASALLLQRAAAHLERSSGLGAAVLVLFCALLLFVVIVVAMVQPREALNLRNVRTPRGRATATTARTLTTASLLPQPRKKHEELSKRPSHGQGKDEDFCPDLLVPLSCECVLLVPTRARLGHFDVMNTKGDVVLHVVLYGSAYGRALVQSPRGSLRPSDSSPMLRALPASGGHPGLVLSTKNGDPLARCVVAAPASGGPPEFQLLRPSGAVYARLSRRAGEDLHVLSVVNGKRLHFWGSFADYAVNVSDDDGKLSATTELCSVEFDKSSEYFRLRVAPLTDVGLVLCSLLCVQCLSCS